MRWEGWHFEQRVVVFRGFLGVDVPFSSWNGELGFMERSEREKKVGRNQLFQGKGAF